VSCTNPDGTLAPVAVKVLRALASLSAGASVDTIARNIDMPVYRARATLRELGGAGLVVTAGSDHRISEAGIKSLEISDATSTPMV
jgi:DNA-binding IclR family transcriptional regulator